VFVVVVVVLCVPVSVMEVVEVVVVRHRLMTTIHAVHVIGVIVAVLPVGCRLGTAHVLLVVQADATSIPPLLPRMSGQDLREVVRRSRCAGLFRGQAGPSGTGRPVRQGIGLRALDRLGSVIGPW